MKLSPVKDLYCGIHFSEEEKERANRLAILEFKKPVKDRIWIEEIIENTKKIYKNKRKRGGIKFMSSS